MSRIHASRCPKQFDARLERIGVTALSRSALLAVTLALSACASEGGTDDSDEGIETTSSSVINGSLLSSFPGTPPPLVAVYHGFMRPCSGTQITRDGWVITAAHCMTQGDCTPGAECIPQADDPPLPISTFRATPPGTPSPGLQPPAGAVGATEAYRYGDGSREVDIGLIKFPGLANPNFTSTNLKTTSLYFGDPTLLIGEFQKLNIWGYGRNVIGGLTDDGTTGAGTLRWGTVYASGVNEGHSLLGVHSLAGLNQITWHGDSGGGIFLRNIVSTRSDGTTIDAPLLVGVNRTSNGWDSADEVLVARVITFLNAHIPSFYIKHTGMVATDGGYMDVKFAGSADGTPVWLWHLTDTSAQHWQYVSISSKIRNENGKCLTVQGGGTASGTPVVISTCSGGPSQRWIFGLDGTISNNGNGMCLATDTNSDQSPLIIRPCSSNDFQQKWLISGAP